MSNVPSWREITRELPENALVIDRFGEKREKCLVCPKCGGFLMYFKDEEVCRECGHIVLPSAPSPTRRHRVPHYLKQPRK